MAGGNPKEAGGSAQGGIPFVECIRRPESSEPFVQCVRRDRGPVVGGAEVRRTQVLSAGELRELFSPASKESKIAVFIADLGAILGAQNLAKRVKRGERDPKINLGEGRKVGVGDLSPKFRIVFDNALAEKTS